MKPWNNTAATATITALIMVLVFSLFIETIEERVMDESSTIIMLIDKYNERTDELLSMQTNYTALLDDSYKILEDARTFYSQLQAEVELTKTMWYFVQGGETADSTYYKYIEMPASVYTEIEQIMDMRKEE